MTFDEFWEKHRLPTGQPKAFDNAFREVARGAWDTALKSEAPGGAKLACCDGLCAELSLMLDVFNSCIETKTFPKAGSPCQEKIIELMEQCGRKPTALKVRGT